MATEKNSSECSRRQFIRHLTTAGMASFLGGTLLPGIADGKLIERKPPRERVTNPFLNGQGKPLLVVVEGDDFASMLQAGMDALGGWQPVVSGNDVLIKPNCNSIDTYPVVTSGSSMLSLVRALEGVTTGSIRVADEGYHDTQQVYQQSGITDAVAQTRAELLQLSVHRCYNVRHPDWSALKPNYLVFEEIWDTPILINFPCLKRHFLGEMTCALKNNVGVIPGQYASASRSTFHGYSGDAFLAEIAEVACLVNPDLTIVDARGMLVGNGPLPTQAGATIVNDVNRIIISGDMTAVDLYCAQILESYDALVTNPAALPHFQRSMINPTIQRAYERGLGVGNLNDVEIIEISTTGVKETSPVPPHGFSLHQNYPNPFNATTTIPIHLNVDAHAVLDIFDARGRKVMTLLDQELSAGTHSIRLHANRWPSGQYAYHLKTGNHVESKTMILMK